MIHEVKMFAAARDAVDAHVVRVDLPESATVADLRVSLAAQFPQLATLLAQSLVAINEEYASEHRPVPVGAEIALIPPVSGG